MELAHLLRWNEMLQNMMQRDAVAVQCTLFDKTPKKNWFGAASRLEHSGEGPRG
jgi:hypothetical protein